MISLVGISTTTLLWLAVGVGGVISVLYLLRLRRRQVIVPFLPLWQKVVQQSQYQSLWQRLRRLVSWLLQMLLLLLLLLALADPRLRAELFSGRNVVVVIDSSASMKAQDGRPFSSTSPEKIANPKPVGTAHPKKPTDRVLLTRMDEAKAHARQLIRSLVGHDQLMLVSMDAEVIPLTPFSSDKSALLKALDKLQPSDTQANVKRALWLANDALHGRKRGEVVVISDGAFSSEMADILTSSTRKAASPPQDPSRSAVPERRKETGMDDPGVPTQRTQTGKATQEEPKQAKPPTSPRKKKVSPPKRRATKRKLRSRPSRPKAKNSRRTKTRRTKKPHKPRQSRTAAIKPRVREAIVLPHGIKRRLEMSVHTAQSTTQRALPPFRWIKVGHLSDNVGIVALSARRRSDHPLQFSVYVELHNFGKAPVEGFLELYVGDLIMETVKVTLPAQQRWRRIIPSLTGQGQKLTARFKVTQGRDLLLSDNQAFAVLPKAQAMRVLLVGEDNLYLQAALLADPQIVMESVACGRESTVKKPYDAAIYHQCAPTVVPKTGRYLFFDPPKQGTPFGLLQKRGDFVYNKEVIVTDQQEAHPVMQYLSFRDLNVQRAKKFRLQSGDSALVSSFGQPLIVAHQSKGLRAIAVGYSLRESDMVLRVLFPLFLRNALQWLQRGGRSAPPTTHQTGGIWSISVPEHLTQVGIVSPTGVTTQLPARDGMVLYSGKQTGFYRIVFPKQEQWMAANLADPQESQIEPGVWDATQGKKAPASSASLATGLRVMGIPIPIPQPIWLYLLLLVVVLLGLEWFTYNRRVTV